jgi:hypothetical protein
LPTMSGCCFSRSTKYKSGNSGLSATESQDIWARTTITGFPIKLGRSIGVMEYRSVGYDSDRGL